MVRVLITRAEPEASATAALVRQHKFEAVVLPLTQTEALPDGVEAVRGLGEFPNGLTIATSVRAIDVLDRQGFGSWIARQRWAVVGERAARRLQYLGASLAFPPADHVAALVANLSGNADPMAYLCAVDRKEVLEKRFPAMRAIPVYQAKALGGFSPDDGVALNANPPTHALVYSARGAHLLADAVASAGLEEVFDQTLWLCLSHDVAVNLPDGTLSRVAKTPTQEALLALLP